MVEASLPYCVSVTLLSTRFLRLLSFAFVGSLTEPGDMDIIALSMPAVTQSLIASSGSPTERKVSLVSVDEERNRSPDAGESNATRILPRGTNALQPIVNERGEGERESTGASSQLWTPMGVEGMEETKGEEPGLGTGDGENAIKTLLAARGAIPPPIATRAISTVTDERESAVGSRYRYLVWIMLMLHLLFYDTRSAESFLMKSNRCGSDVDFPCPKCRYWWQTSFDEMGSQPVLIWLTH